jgi:hypothetical protein
MGYVIADLGLGGLIELFNKRECLYLAPIHVTARQAQCRTEVVCAHVYVRTVTCRVVGRDQANCLYDGQVPFCNFLYIYITAKSGVRDATHVN